LNAGEDEGEDKGAPATGGGSSFGMCYLDPRQRMKFEGGDDGDRIREVGQIMYTPPELSCQSRVRENKLERHVRHIQFLSVDLGKAFQSTLTNRRRANIDGSIRLRSTPRTDRLNPGDIRSQVANESKNQSMQCRLRSYDAGTPILVN